MVVYNIYTVHWTFWI